MDEVVLAGGSARLSGLVDRLAGLFGEEVVITDSIDADQVIARGCAIQAQVIAASPEGSKESAYIHGIPAVPVSSIAELKVQTTSAPLGLARRPVHHTHPRIHPLPPAQVFRLPVAAGASSVALTLDEGVESIQIETLPIDPEDIDEDEEVEPEQVKTAVTKPAGKRIASFTVDTPSKGGKRVLLELTASKVGALVVEAKEEGAGTGVKLVL